MKGGKNPTRQEKQLLKDWRLNHENWLVCKHTNELMVIEHRHTGTRKEIKLT